MEGEVKSAEKVMHDAEKPFLAIIGAPKYPTKSSFWKTCWNVRMTSSLAGNGIYFYKAQGGQIGKFSL